MKVKSLLVGMMACVALGACTNQDLVEGEIGNGNNASTDKAYIGIKIANPTNGFFRAASDGGFDYGTTDEHNISSAEFFFYKDGVYVTKGSVASSDITISGGTSDNIEASVPAVVVLHQAEGEGEIIYPNQVVAFLNLPSAVSSKLESKSLTDALGTVENISDIEDFATKDKFIMTNSVYTINNVVQHAVAVNVENFAQTAEAAKNNPVTIYVERVAAKVAMSKKTEGFNAPDIEINYKDDNYNLRLEIDGWGINAVNKSSYLVKKITPASWNFTGWTWNDPTNFRSYWAEDANYNSGDYPANWGEYNGNEANSPLEYRSWQDVANNNGATQYCLENTMNAATAGNINATTYMVIAGHYKLVKGNQEETIDENTKLYKYIDRFYLEADLLGVLANQAILYKLENGQFTKLKASDYQIVRASLYDGKLALKATTGNFYTAENENSQVSVSVANEKLAEQLGTFTAFAGGKTFFYTPINHLNTNESEAGHIGIVRNHTYQLTLNGIQNLGNGVFDPDEDIIITEKSKEFYVAATLNILSWKVVEQGVDL